MMGLETIKRMNEEATAQAESYRTQPFVAKYDGDNDVFQCPSIGDYEPEGWEEVEQLFVDTSGFGAPGEPALTADEFLSVVKKDYGYALGDVGQFQAHIRVFRRV